MPALLGRFLNYPKDTRSSWVSALKTFRRRQGRTLAGKNKEPSMVSAAASLARGVGSKAKPMLHVECCIKQPEASPLALAGNVERWLRKRFATIRLNQTISCLDASHSPLNIEFITVADLTSSADFESTTAIHLPGVDISVDLFELYGDEEHVEPSEDTRLRLAQDADEDVSRSHFKTMNLPNRNLHGVWDSLIFENCVQFRLLHFIIRMMSFSSCHHRERIPSWSRTILLYGPPGSGKTSLCQALAQQLSIRLGKKFPVCRLVEFDAHSMFSQYFGESGKVVNKIFATIESMLDEDESTLICVFIDKIESLAVKRQYCSSSFEPQDSLRAANAFLIALDRLRRRPNVLVFCASNMIKSLDSAFLDRVDIKQHIPDPGPRARYEILRSCYLELAQTGIIAPICQLSEAASLKHTAQEILMDDDEDELGNGGPPPPLQIPKLPKCQDDLRVINDRDLPPHHLMMLHFPSNDESLPRTLWKIAAKSANLSGRTLRRLPVVSLAMYASHDRCPIDEALKVLSQAVDDELLREEKDGTGDVKMIDRC